MICQACETRKTNALHGVFFANCEGCKATQSEIALPLHLDHLKRTPASQDRRAYIDTVERKEGQEAAHKLKAAFTQWWGMK